MSDVKPDAPQGGKASRLVSIVSFVVAAVVVTVLLHQCRREPTPGPDRAIAILNGTDSAPASSDRSGPR